MPNRLRTAYANAAAARYAPRPNGSLILYGLISATLLFLGAIVAGAFYSVDVMAYPCYLVGALAAAFIFGAGLRMWRQRAHSAAVDVEFAKRRLSSVKVNVLAPAGSISPAVSPPLDETVEAVTFKSSCCRALIVHTRQEHSRFLFNEKRSMSRGTHFESITPSF